jgi:D-alanyl-D-alanine carboxypeptidase
MKRLFLLVAAVLLSSLPMIGQDEAERFHTAYERIDAMAEAMMRDHKTPGIALALTDRHGLLRVANYGFANKDRRDPVTRETLFGIGSIGKSFTSVAALELHDAHKLDLHEPIVTYLPWFKANSTVPITTHHVLSHTAGFPSMRMELMSSLYQAYWLTEAPWKFEPGKQYHYSSSGYDLASILINQISHETYGQFIQENLLDRLGMRHSEPVSKNAMRPRLALSYEALYDDRPEQSDDPMVQANWYEYGGGAGSIASTPEDLAIYLRMLLNRGQGPNQRILTEESFQLLTQHAVVRGPHKFYGYGMEITEEAGHTYIGHGGGVQGFRSTMLGDMDDGLGIVIFSNSPAPIDKIARFALTAMRAALHNQEIPATPVMDAPTNVQDAQDFAGTYTHAGGGTFTLRAEDSKLLMDYKGQTLLLAKSGKDAFLCAHPDFALFPLRFQREKDAVVEVFYGPDWYTHQRYQGARHFEYPPEWNAYPGHYRIASRQHVNFRVELQKGKLWLINPPGDQTQLMPLKNDLFQVGDTPEWLHFDTVLNGAALRVNYSGTDFHRDFTP